MSGEEDALIFSLKNTGDLSQEDVQNLFQIIFIFLFVYSDFIWKT